MDWGYMYTVLELSRKTTFGFNFLINWCVFCVFGEKNDLKPSFLAKLAIFLLAAIIAPIAAMLLKYAISRQREYLADAQAVLLTRYPKGLIGALTKIKTEYMAPEEVNRGLSHLYFAFPLSVESSDLFSTHPNINSRIARLQTMEYK